MSDREKLIRTLTELLEAETGEKYPSLEEDKNLRDELGLDSVDVVSVVMQIENRFRIRLTQQELEKVIRVGDLLDLIQAKVAEAPKTAAA
jgi:acyl carrier protein